MDLRKVKKLIELVQESGISELEVSSGDEAIRIAMHQGVPAVTPVLAADSQPVVATSSEVSPAVSVTSPMAGTFYRAPSPESDPFVEVGSRVESGDIVCIIESMKMMHEIRATQSGVVSAIEATNGEPIGTGDVLFVLR